MTFIKNNSYLLLIMGLCLLFALIGTKKVEQDVVFDEITIVEGDTLWELSERYGENMSPEQWITQVKELNNLTSATIIAGEELKLPRIDTSAPYEIATHFVGDEE